MTRESAKIYEYLEYDLCGDEIDHSVLKLQVEAVKKYLQSRTCENCTYYRQGCDLVTFTSHEINDFGCLKFERKEDA